MKIYLATSWKLASAVKAFAELFRNNGHEVYCFAEKGYGQHHFNWQDIPNYKELDGITGLKTEDSIKAYNSDKWSLDWCNCCILLNPCGRDAHLEAGYVKGRGSKLYIVGQFPNGEFSNMYHLADGLFKVSTEELDKLLVILKDESIKIIEKGK